MSIWVTWYLCVEGVSLEEVVPILRPAQAWCVLRWQGCLFLFLRPWRGPGDVEPAFVVSISF